MKPRHISWETFSRENLRKVLSADLKSGLSAEKIERLQKRHGKNILEAGEDLTFTDKIAKQFKSPLVIILLGAGITTLFLREFLDTIVIFAALFINVGVGVFQEERASKAFEKLNKSQIKHATVIRDGKKAIILSENLIPGDLVILEGGSQVPADIRILEAKNLSVNEAALTGEWAPVRKNAEIISKRVPLSKRANMAWMGTLVSSGGGIGIVVEIGRNTQVGIIAKQLGTIEDQLTPLQHGIRKIARFLIYIILAAIVVIFLLGVLRGEPLGEMLLIAIAIAVATMPEGLPAAVTVVLALGMESILKYGGLVRNLLAAETLGATTVILTDKTGTLTEAKMKLASLYTLESLKAGEKNMIQDDKELLTMAVLSSDAFVEESKDAPRKLIVHGRPIEKAIIIAGLEMGISADELQRENQRIDFLKFESKRRFSASLNKYKTYKKNRIYLSGEPEFLIEHSTHVLKNGKAEVLLDKDYSILKQIQRRESAKGMRFIGISYKDVSWEDIEDGERKGKTLAEKAVFAGFIAFEDPVRKDVKEAIAKVKKAGARVTMITGDNPETAKNIAIKVGIAKQDDQALLGSDIELQDDEMLLKTLQKVKIFARVLPDQKLRIVRVLRGASEVVAMTGDGINDAPALRSANIGVAVGSGTEVAKEAADIILLNNSFSIIVSAIEEGRKIIDNLKKILAYLLSTSFVEVFIIVGALVAGVPIPLLPSQILWANIIEEGLMSFAFAFEKKDKNIMKKDPRSHTSKNILTPIIKKFIFTIGIVTGLFLTALYFMLLKMGMPIEEIRTMMFILISIDSIFFTFSLKSFDTPLWRINIFSNKFLIIAFVFNTLLLIAAILFSPLRTLLSLTVLSISQMLFLASVGIFNLITIEVAKYYLFFRKKV
ncbi:MAG: HAD-IC family P-type ATPase [Candidatus Pacebacteria bacterium]|jgi:Ca2+-transporting ATPase|nr:HAD-IC family P-type ATPase [Candidatus Paceibacterota bacterium]|tara:strand:- start:14297 stop:16963 length:2667 start_codon:yes stop_codon:yes gene_type:complete